MTELYIDEIYPKASVNPILFTFQNGYTNESFEDVECKLFSNQISKRKHAASTIGDILYAGDEESDATNNTFLLVRNKVTNKVRVIECTSIELRPQLKDSFKTAELQDASFLELSRKFGSKKQRQKVESRHKLKIDVDTVTNQMKSVKETVKVNTSDVSSYTESNLADAYIPPINRDATSVDDIFEIDKILTDEQFEKISGEIESKDLDSELLPIVTNTLSNGSGGIKNKVLALYANSLLGMYNTLTRELTKKSFVICQSSSTLNEIVLHNFMQEIKGRRCRSTQLRDKALCHAIVFLLLMGNYLVPLTELSQAVKISPKTVITKVKAIGAHIKQSGQNKMIELKLPLNTAVGFQRRKSAKF